MSSTRPNPRRALALAVLCLMQMMIILDGSIVAVALPVVQQELGFSGGSVSWIVNGYLVAFAGLLLVFGRLGDAIGTRRVFLAGAAAFTMASLACGLVSAPLALVLARFVQGAGGAAASAVALGMVVRLFPAPSEQARALGVYSFVSAAGSAVGLLAGGALTQALGWRWDFLVNVPIGAVILAAGATVLPTEQPSDRGLDLDWLGAALGVAGLSTSVLAITQSADAGWSGQVIGTAVLGLALVGSFVVRQGRAARPVLPLHLLRVRGVALANAVGLLVFAAGFGFQFTNALYLQRVLGYDAWHTGLAFLPAPIVVAVASLGLSARATLRFGAVRSMAVSLAVVGAGLLLLARAPSDADYVLDVLPALVLAAFGMGLALPALSSLAMGAVAPSETATVSGLVGTTQQVGAALGLAVLAAASSARTRALAPATSTVDALLGGYHVAFALAGASALAASSILVVRSVRRTSRGTEPSTASCTA